MKGTFLIMEYGTYIIFKRIFFRIAKKTCYGPNNFPPCDFQNIFLMTNGQK